LGDLISAENGKIAIEAIQKAIAVYFHVRLINLSCRDDAPKNLAFCRQVAM
jgi:chromosomal replication initiation ATPase DnaA